MPETHARPSKGYALAVAMLIFMVMEVSLLADAWLSGSRLNVYVLYYFGVKAVLCVVQLVGILLVVGGRYRLGGALQLVASAIHVPELLGIVGVLGGLAAYRYPARLGARVDA